MLRTNNVINKSTLINRLIYFFLICLCLFKMSDDIRILLDHFTFISFLYLLKYNKFPIMVILFSNFLFKKL